MFQFLNLCAIRTGPCTPCIIEVSALCPRGAVMYNFMQALDERVLTTPRQKRNAWLVQLVFWLVMFAALDAWTVISYQQLAGSS